MRASRVQLTKKAGYIVILVSVRTVHTCRISAPYESRTEIPYWSSLHYLESTSLITVLRVASSTLCSLSAALSSHRLYPRILLTKTSIYTFIFFSRKDSRYPSFQPAKKKSTLDLCHSNFCKSLRRSKNQTGQLLLRSGTQPFTEQILQNYSSNQPLGFLNDAINRRRMKYTKYGNRWKLLPYNLFSFRILHSIYCTILKRKVLIF